MDLTLNLVTQQGVTAATRTLLAAQQALNEAKKKLDAHVRQVCLDAGLGKGALVEHVHRAAQHGNLSDKVVTSVVHSARGGLSQQAVLVVRLGKVSGGQGDAVARLNVADVLRIASASANPFGS